jgi:hypothetical protein
MYAFLNPLPHTVFFLKNFVDTAEALFVGQDLGYYSLSRPE